MVWVSTDASDDAASSIDCVKAKPLKRRCAGGGLGRAGGLSRYYSSKSQSFSSLELVTQCTPYGTSSLALAKRRSSFDLQRQAEAAAAAAAVAVAAVPGAGVIAKSCSARLVGGSSSHYRSGGGSPAAPSSARAAAAARFASAFAAACSLAAAAGHVQDGTPAKAPGVGRSLLGGCSSSDDDVDLLLSGDGEADDVVAPERRCGSGDALCHADGQEDEGCEGEEGPDGFLEEDEDGLLCGPSSRRCPCNDTIFTDPSDAVLSPDASPPLQHLSLQAYAAGAGSAANSRAAAMAAAAALTGGGSCAGSGVASGLAVAQHQLALQQQLTAEYCNRLAAVLLPSGHSGAAFAAACGSSSCSSGGYMGGYVGLPPMAPAPASRPTAVPRAPLHAFRSTDWDGGAAAAAAGAGAIGACAAAGGGPRIWTSLSAGGVASGPSCFDNAIMQHQQDARRPDAPSSSGGAVIGTLPAGCAGLAPVLTAPPHRASAQHPSCALAGLALSQPGSGDWASSPLLQAPTSASSPIENAAATAAAAGGSANTRTTAQSGYCGLGPQHPRNSHHRTARHHGSPAQLSSLWGSTENLIASLSLSEQQQQQGGLLHHHSAKRRGHGRSLSHRSALAAAAAADEPSADPMAVDAQASCCIPQHAQPQHPQMLHEPLPACLASAFWSAGGAAGGCPSACVSIPPAHAAAAAVPQAPHVVAALCPWAPYGSAPAHGSASYLSSTIR
ncbi:hypothetical protein HXX76_008976 [Chlamydomonas incerta]|uniref:Uncharacterized protein n=1 Tax=Chlamydomonas incerta TaxID=51695 RepID=A0A835T6S1_CHLIN|nr:hypothetical protein HXX76_008976 [Chlamydomonas incerta]|eukprot:KAG2432636.1 hypothetical protein HXX76_008976 [Chlamydomonas incerta]